MLVTLYHGFQLVLVTQNIMFSVLYAVDVHFLFCSFLLFLLGKSKCYGKATAVRSL
jgi:hypothetical protein